MKKALFLIAMGIVCGGLGSLFAQNIPQEKQSEYFYVNIPLERIFPYRLGYVVQYRTGINRLGTAYLPLEWFEGTGGKADLIQMAPGTSWPYLTVFYKGGEFSHLRLYVRREPNHETWGSVPFTVNIDDKFQNVDTLKLDF